MVSHSSSPRLYALGLSLFPMMMALTSAFRVSVVQAAHRQPTFTLQQANQLIDPLSRLLQELDESVVFPLWRHHTSSVVPKGMAATTTFSVDILESPVAYVINADLPGVSKEDIKVTCENGVLAIQAQRKDGSRKAPAKPEEGSSSTSAATSDVAPGTTAASAGSSDSGLSSRLVSEVAYGTFQRSFKLPPNTDAERIEAAMDKGVLTITLPKTEPPKEKVIQIKDEVAVKAAAA